MKPDLMTYLLCVAILVDPVNRAINIGRLWQEGLTGFDRFMDMLDTAPDTSDRPGARTLTEVRGASRAEIMEAAGKAHAHDFIAALPQGYDTDVGQRGVKLSGGQKQRLTIARVFPKDPPILIFDEATSALNYDSERAVQAALHELAENRTTLVIAHWLSTLRHAYRIVVMTQAGIAEQGSHEALIATGGAYAALFNNQASI